MKQSCGYACIIKVLKTNKISYDEYFINQFKYEELSLFDIKTILATNNMASCGMYIPLSLLSNGDILHLQIFGYRHYVILIRKGLFCIYYDNNGYHIVPRFILNIIYSKHALCLNRMCK